MPWSGTGTFTRVYDWTTDRDNGVKILATEFDTEDDGFATGINACLAKNGENAATGNLNLGGFKLTNGANATARTDFPLTGQIQDGSAVYAATTGTNTIAATLAPAITAYANGQIFRLKILNTTTAAATLNINSVGALNMYYADGTTQLNAGALIATNSYAFLYDSSLNASAGGFICLNPSDDMPFVYAAMAGTSTLTASPAGIGAYVNGQTVKLKAGSTTTGAATLNLNSIGAKNVYVADGTTAIPVGAIIANNIYDFEYNSSLNAAAGGFVCINPSRVSSSFSLTYATGFATTPTVTINYYIEPDGRHIDVACYAGSVLTSSATVFTGTGVPAAIQTITDHRVYFPIEDSGAFGGTTRLSTGASTGTWTFFIGLLASGWTNPGNKGILAGAFTSFTND
jgi:hypothetical protein